MSTARSEIGGINAPRNYSVTANLEGLVRWETGGGGSASAGGGNQHITSFKSFEKIKIDDDHSAEGYYILTLHPKPGLQPLVLVYHTTNGYRANKWQLALTYCIDRANGKFGGGGTIAARPVEPQHTLPTQPYPNPAVAPPANYQAPAAMQATTQPSYPPPTYQQTYQQTPSNQPPPAPYPVASSLPVHATEVPPQTAVAVAMVEPSPQPLPPHKDPMLPPPPPPAYRPPTSYTAGAVAVADATANNSSSSLQQQPTAPIAPASIPLSPSSSVPAPAPAPAVKSTGDGALDDLAARFAALQKRN